MRKFEHEPIIRIIVLVLAAVGMAAIAFLVHASIVLAL